MATAHTVIDGGVLAPPSYALHEPARIEEAALEVHTVPRPAPAPPTETPPSDRRSRGPAVNRVALLGRLTTDPVLRFTPAGLAVCNLRIATNERDEPEYHDCVAWRELAQLCAEHLTRGRLIYVEGRLHSHTWEAQDGSTRRSVEVAADEIQFLSPRPSTASSVIETDTD